MQKNPTPRFGFFNPRFLSAFTLCIAGACLAIVSFAPAQKEEPQARRLPPRYMPVAGEKGEDLDRMEQEWNNRLTYPTGLFNPEWLRLAAVKDSLIARAIPAGLPLSKSALA